MGTFIELENWIINLWAIHIRIISPEAFKWKKITAEKINSILTSSAVRDEHFILCKNNNLTAGAESERSHKNIIYWMILLSPVENFSAILFVHNKIMQIPAWDSSNDNLNDFLNMLIKLTRCFLLPIKKSLRPSAQLKIIVAFYHKF